MLSQTGPRSGVEPAADFERLFHALYPRLCALAYRVVGDRAEAEDVAQEAFVRLADAPVAARPDDEVAAWLRRVCLNLALNRARDERRARERLERAGRQAAGGATEEALDPLHAALRLEQRDRVRQALDALPERQRACLLLRYAGHSYVEVATTLGLATGSVGVLLARAERAFRESYQVDLPDVPGELPGDAR